MLAPRPCGRAGVGIVEHAGQENFPSASAGQDAEWESAWRAVVLAFVAAKLGEHIDSWGSSVLRRGLVDWVVDRAGDLAARHVDSHHHSDHWEEAWE